MKQTTIILTIIALCIFNAGCAEETKKTEKNDSETEWISLFNGKNLDGWTPKITGYDFGENFGDTFRVEDGVMKVSFDKYEKFNGRFGHIFYDSKFSHYRIRLQYRFIGKQAPGGPGWAIRNSGIMIHCQDPKTMSKKQKFPVSIEVQILGGDGENERTTGNLCTPGTNVVIDGTLRTGHCTIAKSETYHGDQWVTAEVEVHGAEVVRHKINGKVVLEYQNPQLDERDADAKKLLATQPMLLSEGYISLQSESHPCEFRNIEILLLEN